MIRTSFNPVQHGFKFPNNFVNNVITVPSLGIDVDTFGRCGGMAFASLDYWYHQLAIPQDSSLPTDGTLVGTYLYDRLMESILANAFKHFHFMRTPDHPTWINGIGVARATREEEFPKLRQMIDQSQPCILGLTNATNIGEFGINHQVVAYGYEVGDPNSTVLIYDNNYPDAEIRLTFTTAYDPGDRPVHHSRGHDWRGFFVESFAPQTPPFLASGSLLSEFSHDEIYVVRGGGRFWINSPEEFDGNGFSWSAVRETANGSLNHVSTYPANGTLVSERGADPIYVVYGGAPFHIPSPEVFEAMGFRWDMVAQIPNGSVAGLRKFPADGTLLREITAPEIYLVENGKIRHIPSPEKFEALGFSWGNVGTVPDGAMRAYPKGPPI
jgi:hypothetical protein